MRLAQKYINLIYYLTQWDHIEAIIDFPFKWRILEYFITQQYNNSHKSNFEIIKLII